MSVQSNIEVVRSYFIAIDKSNLEIAGQYLDDNFHSYGSMVDTLGKPDSLHVLRALKLAMPDLCHILSNMEAEGPLVRLTIQVGGRHMNALNLADMRMNLPHAVIPASGRMIIFLPRQFEYVVVNGKIVSERDVTPTTLYNGATGFLNALGYAE